MKKITHNSKKSILLIIFSCFLMASIIGVYSLVYRPENAREENKIKQEQQVAYEESEPVNQEETDGSPSLKAALPSVSEYHLNQRFFL